VHALAQRDDHQAGEQVQHTEAIVSTS
jgi:hypothetical protein